MIVQNIRTGGYVAIMIRCGNPRLKSGPLRRVKIKVIKRIYIRKSFKQTVSHTCPSGQAVTITASGKIKGWLRVSARGWASAARIYVSGKVSLAVSQKVTVACGGAPVAPPPPAYDACVNIEGNQSTIPGGMIINAIGNCVTQTNNAEQRCIEQGGSYNSNTITGDVTCTIIQVNGNCSNIIVVNGSGNVISSTQEGNCNQNPSDEPTDSPPQISCVSPAHVFVGGNVQVYCEASDPDGDALSVNIVNGNPAGHVSGIVDSLPSGAPMTRWDGSPCPTGVKCYRATFWGDSVGMAYLTATVTAGGEFGIWIGSFPVLADNRGF